ncbi:Carbamoyl-phosphate synthase (glutamine-hydrolyzing) [Plasmodiophora brassicae]|uniref:Carbamoyl-phosphate synthase (glutamine-hydrolyzing) n=1 Tax=Plasmodiophora brassicae TaxID=37360 RepID=A0A3P3Y6S2_PLABS|nr:unnamed protein product [Plasmodiophora brassicae]
MNADPVVKIGFSSASEIDADDDPFDEFQSRIRKRHSTGALVPSSVMFDAVNAPTGQLVLNDGTVMLGISFGADVSIAGEVVFTTGMVGYPETLTDLSYKGQILVLTYPLVGNYGVPSEDVLDDWGLPKFFESDSISIAALIVTCYSHEYSHWNASSSLSAWLKKHNVPAICGVDTRALTKRLRDQGSMLGKVVINGSDVEFHDPNQRNLIAEVSRKVPQVFGNGPTRIVAVDLGIKNNIIRCLATPDVTLTVVPWDYDYTDKDYDGIFLSNGPGDPTMAGATIEVLKKALKGDTPIFGICMGHQVLALAAGARTYKMRFGNRGMNQPVIDLRTTRCYITPQNHGFAVDDESLPPGEFVPLFRNANDNSNEGLIHRYKPFMSVQFHPEACGGPDDTNFLFDMFLARVKDNRSHITTVNVNPTEDPIRKVLLLGSGGLSIGQAGEFDYSGSQAIKALKEHRVTIVLINPNIATIQTTQGMADKVYFLPVTPEFVSEIIQKERPDGLLLQFGGQTALNCGLALEERGILKKFNVRVLGTSCDTIRASEDRQLFAEKLAEINESVAPSGTSSTVEGALRIAERLGYPVLVRAAFALGGLGSGFADNADMLTSIVKQALANSPQVIVDKSLRGWKEIEYEIVRDRQDNCIAVCNMENFDPLGIHTGDSIVVAPSQTLSNSEFFKLRDVSLKLVRHMKIIGECNVQFALDPHSEKYCIIEMNPRLSRSSALASKATGYPLAYVAAHLAMGMTLPQVKNSVTKKTTACFEPSLDYIVVKMPRWDLRKFWRVSNHLGSSMKSVGEIMAIGRSFEEAFQKGVRMVDGELDGFGDSVGDVETLTRDELDNALRNPDDRRLLYLAAALRRGYTVERIHELTFIDQFFLCKLRNIIQIDMTLSASPSLWSVSPSRLLEAKRAGFGDQQIGRCCRVTEPEVRKYRQQSGVLPYVKQIDTLAAEFPAVTNYLYMTYNAVEHDVAFTTRGVIVLGCGAYRIGSSCEFDWCAVSCLRTLRSLDVMSVMINYNPETVSTDYDECDRLYFEELSFERVVDIYECEMGMGVVVSVGGQIPNCLALPLHRYGVRILGTHPNSIDSAEDRHKFSELLDSLGVDQPEWQELTTIPDALKFAAKVGYPCLVRPSYVLSGAAMNVAFTDADLEDFLTQACNVSTMAPVVMTKFIENAKEIEFDAVAHKGVVVNYAISEHVENAGVHSGDATLILPAQKLYMETIRLVKRAARRIAAALNITGPFNIQFLSRDNEIKVIECNLRASRSFPFVSKTFNVNFIELSTKAMVGKPVKPQTIDLSDIPFVCCKAPMFSFTRLAGADPALRVEMASTGEVACFGSDRYEAFLKAVLSTGFRLPKRNILFSAASVSARLEFLESARELQRMGFSLYATHGTAAFLEENDVNAVVVHKLSSGQHPDVIDKIKAGEIDLVINIPDSKNRQQMTDGYHIRRTSVDFSVGLITNIKCAVLLVGALIRVKRFNLKSWCDYLRDGRGGI